MDIEETLIWAPDLEAEVHVPSGLHCLRPNGKAKHAGENKLSCLAPDSQEAAGTGDKVSLLGTAPGTHFNQVAKFPTFGRHFPCKPRHPLHSDSQA